ncbi:hypothetical protein G4B88_013435 [Cannabis sativa]|uniref:Uncharacterized protein n=1 Tax=Cannabis sativa TaxID=3483 RepID=A0A7J6HL03_CANSA|nr:hypothetical protein G4B88_013435 [Cannabis sativa]
MMLNVFFTTFSPSVVEGRTLKIRHNKQGYDKYNYLKNFDETLGAVCKCCDGEGGSCTRNWNAPCSKLQCLPWKFHHY